MSLCRCNYTSAQADHQQQHHIPVGVHKRNKADNGMHARQQPASLWYKWMLPPASRRASGPVVSRLRQEHVGRRLTPAWQPSARKRRRRPGWFHIDGTSLQYKKTADTARLQSDNQGYSLAVGVSKHLLAPSGTLLAPVRQKICSKW